jgi:hypothetical protein
MQDFDQAHEDYKVAGVTGRYVHPSQVDGFLATCPKNVHIVELGKSVEGRPIQMAELGSGKVKILMWSQMHGNESTTTKAVLDAISFLSSQNPIAKELLKKCQFRIIVMLNPDGAVRYTRENANGVDLNRDALDQTQPESKILRKAYEAFSPNFSFNLHDQRTIYNVGESEHPATLSFLAPSMDSERTINKSREVSMQLIAAINEVLQKVIPGNVGRYDDAFNANCIGDSLQMLGAPTLLFEAGHFPGDYEREIVRKHVFHSLLVAITAISNKSYLAYNLQSYFNIPENNKRYFDILIRNYRSGGNKGRLEDMGILFREDLVDGQIQFVPYLQERGKLNAHYGHQTYDFNNEKDREYLRNSSLSSILGF